MELKFLMLPYESSKNSTRKSIFFDTEDEEYIFEISKLGGYSGEGGIKKKAKLLRAEQKN